MLRLERTERISIALDKWLSETQEQGAYEYSDQWIGHRFLIKIASELPDTSLATVIKGTGVWFEPPPPSPPKSPEYVEFMSKIRADIQEREYQRLAGREPSSGGLTAQELKEIKEQVTTVVNILVSVAAVTLAFWFWSASKSPAVRTLISLGAALVTAVAETVVYMGYKRRIAEARSIEARKKERKRTVKTVLGPGAAVSEKLEEVSTTNISPKKETTAILELPPIEQSRKGLRQRRKHS